jgi:predicted CXXCH cytochrome family protein
VQFSATGFSGTVLFTVTPKLPAGFILNADTGRLTGTPADAQTSTGYIVTASDGVDESTAALAIAVGSTAPSLAPLAQTVSAIADKPITSTTALTATGFAGTVTYSASPKLPKGLVIDSATGVISGIGTQAQAPTPYDITADDGTDVASATVTIDIKPILEPLTQSVDGQIGVPITPSKLVGHGFTPAAVFEVTTMASPLPAGLALDPATGIISGTPTTAQVSTTSIISATEGALKAEATVNLTIFCADLSAAAPGCLALKPMAMATQVTIMSVSPHTPGAGTSADTCALCHRAHVAKQSEYLGPTQKSSTQLCFSCHDGTGASNILVQYAATDPNVPATDTVFEHRWSTASTPTSFTSDENANSVPKSTFAGRKVRQSECVDCHNPHDATNRQSTRTLNATTNLPDDAKPWLAGGPIQGASGVKYTPAATPKYQLLGGSLGKIIYEYELCYKCHSSYTTPNLVTDPDVAAEFATTNKSFHPVEGVGTNTSAVLNSNLAKGSTWQFTTGQTVRCAHCHASIAVTGNDGKPMPRDIHAVPIVDPATAPAPLRKGILLGNYRQDLTIGTYDANDYSLCFQCHDPAGIASDTNTNFNVHSKHVSEGFGCPTCHYNLHGIGTPQGNSTGRALVSFPPNPNRVVTYISSAPGTGTCSVSGNGCHGLKPYPKL